MANLKGGTYEKQVKDASMRMNKIGQKKDGGSKGSHSVRTHENRKDMLNQFAAYATENNLDSKLNKAMTTDNIHSFFNERLAGLEVSTQESYIRSFGAMIESLKENNISVNSSNSDYSGRIEAIKRDIPTRVVESRAIENPGQVIANINSNNFTHGVVASVQYELGLRVSEAVEVVNNLDKYLNERNGTLEGVIGKGGREYIAKDISPILVAKIELADSVKVRDYQRTMEHEGIKSHDFRYTFAKERNEEGMSKEEISRELNHSRIEIVNYYLSRA